MPARIGALCAIGVCGAMLLIWAAPAHAVVLGQVDSFQDGTTLGWRHGSPTSPLPPVNVASGGPAGEGDRYLLIQTDGNEEGSASRMLALNTAQWTGDYLVGGVGQVRLDARNPNPVELVLRLGFRSGGGNFVTDGITLPAGSAWTQLTFDLGAANMAYASGTYEACFGGVTMLRILHNPSTPMGDSGEPVRDAAGNPLPASLHIDNITAVPEPALWSAAGALILALMRFRRCSAG